MFEPHLSQLSLYLQFASTNALMQCRTASSFKRFLQIVSAFVASIASGNPEAPAPPFWDRFGTVFHACVLKILLHDVTF
jgi:hypothetical protein